MSDLHHYALSAVYGQPLLVSQARLEQVLSYLESRALGGVAEGAGEVLPPLPPAAAFAVDLYKTEAGTQADPNRIAVIPVHGTMLRRGGGFMNAVSGVISCLEISRAVRAAMEDPAVRGVA